MLMPCVCVCVCEQKAPTSSEYNNLYELEEKREENQPFRKSVQHAHAHAHTHALALACTYTCTCTCTCTYTCTCTCTYTYACTYTHACTCLYHVERVITCTLTCLCHAHVCSYICGVIPIDQQILFNRMVCIMLHRMLCSSLRTHAMLTLCMHVTHIVHACHTHVCACVCVCLVVSYLTW